MPHTSFKLQRDEREMYVVRRHWMAFVLRSWAPVLVILGTASLLGLRIVGREPEFLGRQPPVLDGFNTVLVLLLSGALLMAVYHWVDWHNDLLIVTNKRIVHEERTLWQAHRYTIIPLEQVQNVNVRISNIVQYLLQYGLVIVQAAGPGSSITFERVKCPNDVQRRIMNEVKRQKRRQEKWHVRETVERHLGGTPPPSLPPQGRAHTSMTGDSIWHQLLPLKQNGTITWHRHWVILLQQMAGPVFALVFWLGLLWFWPSSGWFSPTVNAGMLVGVLILVLFYACWQYEDWRNDVYVLEPTKVIDVERMPFGLFEDRREASLGMIQNVNATSPGVIARILGYGDVLIETAGAAGNLTFDHVPDPDQVQRLVFEYWDHFKWQQREREWNTMLDMLDLYLQSRHDGNSA
jgi:membrane protein YdbS with pleckstrin-like domain